MSNTADSTTIGGALVVTGTTTLTGAVTTTAALTSGTTITAADVVTTDDITCGDDLTVTGKATITETLTQTGVATFAAPPVIPTIAFASLPAATVAGQICYCTTGDGGNPGLLITNGTNWIAMSDGDTAAET